MLLRAPPFALAAALRRNSALRDPSRILRFRSDNMSAGSGSEQQEQVPVQFGRWPIDYREVFAETKLSLAIVNLKPVVDGHVLVLPRRVVPRFADLTPDEITDLWTTAQRIGRVTEPAYGATSLTFAVQDGVDAGQTVAHVHVHILPRKKGDFKENDQVYDEIEKNEQVLDRDSKNVKMDEEEDRKPRSMEEMAAEASKLRALLRGTTS